MDRVERDGFTFTDCGNGYLKVSCTGCQACVLQGVPCHETGCRNQAVSQILVDEEALWV
jgi:hypothetical protein